MMASTSVVRSATRLISRYGNKSAPSSSSFCISSDTSSSSSCSSIRYNSSSAEITTNNYADPNAPNFPTPPTPHNAYMWGTSKQGTIPLSLLKNHGGSVGGDSSSSGGMFSASDTIMDHPMSLNLEQDSLSSFLGMNTTTTDETDTDNTTTTEELKLQQIFCGAHGTAITLTNGQLYIMGSNKKGELGIGPSSEKQVLKPIHIPLPDPIAKISLGPNSSAFLTTMGDLYTCGYGGSLIDNVGCLGLGDTTSHSTPTIVQSLIEDGCYASDVHCGEQSMTVLTTEGEVLTCGSGSYGRLGNFETFDQLYLEPVEMLAGEDVVQIAGGFAFSLALSRGGIVYAWGRNNEGQLGGGVGLAVDVYAMESFPSPIEGNLEGRQVTRIAAGHSHAAAITSNGELFTWGMNIDHEPKLETSLLHTKIVDVACGQNYTLALDEEGRVYSMGKGKTGVLGLASTKRTTIPTLVEGIPAGEKVVSMSAGWAHVACTTISSE